MLWTVHGASVASRLIVSGPSFVVIDIVRFVVGVGVGSGGKPTSLVAGVAVWV